MSDDSKPQVFANRWADAAGPGGRAPSRDLCGCIEQTGAGRQRPTRFHPERQDTRAPGWIRLLELVEEAAADGREVFKPLAELTAEQRRQVITLPPAVARLTSVRHLVLYGSNLVRLPPEIGAMKSLEEFTPYTSYRLHWFPYEITRCPALRRSTVSTRALYGNYKRQPPFPELPAAATGGGGADLADLDPGVRGTSGIRSCSVCDRPVGAAELPAGLDLPADLGRRRAAPARQRLLHGLRRGTARAGRRLRTGAAHRRAGPRPATGPPDRLIGRGHRRSERGPLGRRGHGARAEDHEGVLRGGHHGEGEAVEIETERDVVRMDPLAHAPRQLGGGA